MASTPEEKRDESRGDASHDQAQAPVPQKTYPGCSTFILAVVVLLLVSMGIVGVLLLAGVNLHDRFWVVFLIFAGVGAFMSPLARKIQYYLEKKDE